MKRFFLLALLLIPVAVFANVVRLAPNFTWEGAGKTTSLRSLHGQPVVLIVAKSARERAFRAQVKKLRELYREFAARQVVFAVALTEGDAEVQSDIPFVIAANGARVAADYGVSDDFNVIIIGKDGNVDLQSSRVCPAARVRDVIINSFAVQAAGRK